jgi:hypothetical protein
MSKSYQEERAEWIDTEERRQKDMALHVRQLEREIEYFEDQASINKQRLEYASGCLESAVVALDKYKKG